MDGWMDGCDAGQRMGLVVAEEVMGDSTCTHQSVCNPNCTWPRALSACRYVCMCMQICMYVCMYVCGAFVYVRCAFASAPLASLVTVDVDVHHRCDAVVEVSVAVLLHSPRGGETTSATPASCDTQQKTTTPPDSTCTDVKTPSRQSIC